MSTTYLVLPGYTPVSVNRLLSGHWAKAKRVKDADRELVRHFCGEQGLLGSGTGKPRRIHLHVTLARGQRAPDPDNCWKVLIDSLVHAGVLQDDAPRWFQQGGVFWARSPDRRMTVVEIVDL